MNMANHLNCIKYILYLFWYRQAWHGQTDEYDFNVIIPLLWTNDQINVLPKYHLQFTFYDNKKQQQQTNGMILPV